METTQLTLADILSAELSHRFEGRPNTEYLLKEIENHVHQFFRSNLPDIPPEKVRFDISVSPDRHDTNIRFDKSIEKLLASEAVPDSFPQGSHLAPEPIIDKTRRHR